MYVHWKSLFGFGFIFWLVLCATDFFGEPRLKRTVFEESFDSELVEQILDDKVQTRMHKIEQMGNYKYGWTLIVWNTIAFVFSFLFCSFARTISWIIWRFYKYYNNKRKIIELERRLENASSERSNVSKIPVLTSKSTATIRSSDTSIKLRKRVSAETSCPNLLAEEKHSIEVQTVPKPTCQMLFKNKLFTETTEQCSKFDKHFQNECARLKEEMLVIQANSLREHAVLSRKLDAVTREKRELSRQLAVAHKENRAAKQQLEELLQEKTMLLDRLDHATKEFKTNTKTKKVALAKLEEVTDQMDDLKQQLEQVTRDKEILEGKLRVLEDEYEKLQERLLTFQKRDSRNCDDAPERDDAPADHREHVIDVERIRDDEISSTGNLSSKGSEIFPTSVSQTQLDMKKIQIKIKQLEKNLENFNPRRPNFNQPGEADIDDSWSEPSLSFQGNVTDSQNRGDVSEFTDSNQNSPRLNSWTNRREQLMLLEKIHGIAPKPPDTHQKLENITENDEAIGIYESSSCDERCEPRRIVSSSAAFQNFLRNLNSTEAVLKPYCTSRPLHF